MNKTIGLLSVTALIILLNCCQDKSNKPDIDPLFQEFLSGIPNKTLPINFHCGLSESESSNDFEKYKSFIPKSANRIFGTIDSKSETYKLIIYGYIGDDIYPVLFSFDHKGQIRDSLNLILNPCGAADDKQIPNSRITIDNSLTIILTDTTELIHYPGHWKKLDDSVTALDEDIPDSVFVTTGSYIIDSLRISKETFKVSNEGRFVKQ